MGRNKLRVLAVFGAALLTLSSAASAAPSKKPTGPAPAVRSSGKGVKAPDAYGVAASTRISVLSYAFQGNEPLNDVIADDGDSYRGFTSNTSLGFSASVSIPAGATITGIGFDNCDNTVTGTMNMTLYDRFGDHEVNIVASGDSSTASGCGFNDYVLETSYDVDTNEDHVFEIFISQNIVDPTLKFRSAYVTYLRRVHPGPVAPTFNDVPTSDFGFQYVEALVAAGITGGTGGGNFSPDGNVTRRQMAIFIAKALGLHWPN